VKLLSYNLKDGGLDERGDRLDALVEVVRATDPDILCVMEAGGWHPVGRPGQPGARLARFESGVRMRGWILDTPSASSIGIFLRPGVFPAEVSAARGTFHHGALVVTLPAGTSRSLVVVATHLHPFSATMRAVEAESLCWLAARASQSASFILAGDLNSVSAEDAARGLQPAQPPDSWNVRLLDGRGELDFTPVARLKRAVLVDCFRKANPTSYGATDPTPAFDRGEAGLRIDFVLASPDLTSHLRTCRVVTEPPADRASDHYPILAEFDLPPAGH
jgi:endonuclease/exonuclease/phosphatase family metal-dependent hydrolase